LILLCVVAGAAAAELPLELRRVLTDYEQAWRAKDARALAALFDEDGFVLASGHQPIRGRAAIEKYYTGQGGGLYLTALAHRAEGGTGFIIGTYRAEASGEEAGKFTLTLVRRGGRWMILSDMDNGSTKR